LRSLVDDEVPRETIYVGLDVQIRTVGAVVVRLSRQTVAKIALERDHEDMRMRLIQV